MSRDANSRQAVTEDLENSLSSNQTDRFQRQVDFILEVDKLKRVMRQTILLDRSRRENAAEHSWHIALTVLLLSEYAQDPKVDLFRVMKILLVHDLIEIDAGDTYCYDEEGRQDQVERELKAADRIFNLLPADQAAILRQLWNEFEERKTPESRFANALDRLQPFLHNYFTRGQTWLDNDIKSAQVKLRMQPVNDGAPFLWEYVNLLIDDAVKKGFLSE